MPDFLRRFFDPSLYQGENKHAPYFEGWYYKAETPDGRAVAVIPGISRTRGGETHSFIQLLDAGNVARYYRFPAEAFEAQRGRLDVRIGRSRFTRNGFFLDIPPDGGAAGVSGECHYLNGTAYPIRPWSPGIMGPFSFVPFLECRHGVVLMAGETAGTIAVGNETIRLNGGSGYIEKDWGRSFPDSYFWMQAARFEGKTAAFMLSVAAVPLGRGSITGVIGFLFADGRVRRFATYSGARVRRAEVSQDALQAVIALPHGELHVDARADAAGILRAPADGEMRREARESLRASLRVKLIERGKVVFSGVSVSAGFESGGDAARLDPGRRAERRNG